MIYMAQPLFDQFLPPQKEQKLRLAKHHALLREEKLLEQPPFQKKVSPLCCLSGNGARIDHKRLLTPKMENSYIN